MVLPHVAASPEAAFSPSSGGKPLLDIRDLTVRAAGAAQPLIDNISLSIRQGEVVALVGESGSGKSMTALSLLRLLPRGVSMTGGAITFDGRNLADLAESDMNRLRGTDMAMLFQQPHAMLDPTSRIRSQLAEPLRMRHAMSWRNAFSHVVKLMERVGIPDAAVRSTAYSHELSGGMAQRCMIAAAMGPEPKLMIADEPTTALDVTVQAQILALMERERRERNLSILLITHDLTVVSAFADRIAVMYLGRIVEEGPTEKVMTDPQHPYTKALIRCSLLEPEADGRLLAIPGSMLHSREMASGCRFAPRCSVAHKAGLHTHCCRVEPVLECCTGHDHHTARCHAVAHHPAH